MNLYVIEHPVLVKVFFGNFLINSILFFYLYLKSFWYVCWKLILRFVGDQSDLHRACVMVSKTN